jgi:arylsulfatase
MKHFTLPILLCLSLSVVCPSGLHAQEVLPKPASSFQGKITLRGTESTPWWPAQPTPPTNAPNVLLILLDDAGFGATSPFGGPIPTPTFDRLATNGLRYTQFHTTALCSPTRAALITGRNHHSVHTGSITETATGFPGYDTLMGKDTATIGEIARLHGLNTAWFGKNHNVPDWQTSQAGPFDLWPTALGFEYFYGFIGGDTSQWTPAVFEGTTPIEPYLDNTNYIFNTDMADKAIAWIRQQKSLAPAKPFLVYYAPGATHAPHHAPKSWINQFTNMFTEGWDMHRESTLARQITLGIAPTNAVLTPRPDKIHAWNSSTYSDEDRSLMAYMMQIYAAYMAHTDYEIGRVLDAVRELGQEENTLVILSIGDNGASPEGTHYGTFNELISLNYVRQANPMAMQHLHRDDLGGPRSYNHYPLGWAWAMDSPFQWTKQVASHYGGTRNPLIISWPKRIKDRGGIRTQWHHTIDIVPTILECLGVAEPTMVNGVAQKPIEGVSMVYSFDDPSAPSRRQTQYFEMFGNRAIYHEGWVACTTPATLPWDTTMSPVDIIDGYAWELYHVEDDFSQARNLASEQPERLKELQSLFYSEAAKYNVLPLDSRKSERMDVSTRPSLNYERTEYIYRGGIKRVSEGAAPDLKNHSFTLAADITVTNQVVNGVVATHGGYFAGWSLYVKDGKPTYCYNFCGISNYVATAGDRLISGTNRIVVDFNYDGGGIGLGGNATLLVNAQKVGEVRVGATAGYRLSLDETFDIGEDTGTPVNLDYEVPFRFSDQINQVTITLKQMPSSAEAEVKRAAHQGRVEKGLRD